MRYLEGRLRYRGVSLQNDPINTGDRPSTLAAAYIDR